MTDLVVVSLESWDGVWRRNQHLIWRMLHTDPTLRVLFVEPPADPAHELRSRRRPRLGRGPDDRNLTGPPVDDAATQTSAASVRRSRRREHRAPGRARSAAGSG